jgi:hypothetical protein
MRQWGVFDGEMGIPKGWPQDELVVQALLSHVKLSSDRQAPSWRISRRKVAKVERTIEIFFKGRVDSHTLGALHSRFAYSKNQACVHDCTMIRAALNYFKIMVRIDYEYKILRYNIAHQKR